MFCLSWIQSNQMLDRYGYIDGLCENPPNTHTHTGFHFEHLVLRSCVWRDFGGAALLEEVDHWRWVLSPLILSALCFCPKTWAINFRPPPSYLPLATVPPCHDILLSLWNRTPKLILPQGAFGYGILSQLRRVPNTDIQTALGMKEPAPKIRFAFL